jgi:hypothetical protein
MNIRDIEHMWKVASNNPNHDTNWHDPVVIAFAKLVAVHTLSNIDPSSFMSFQEGVEAGRLAEREAIAQMFEGAPALVQFAQNDKGGCLICGFTPKLVIESIRARGTT